MKKYTVLVREVWVQPVEVTAASKEEAMRNIEDGGGTPLSNELEYSHTMDSDIWSIKEVEEVEKVE